MEPQPRLGLAALSRIAFDGGDLSPIRTELTAQALKGSAAARMDLSVVEQLEGNLDAGLDWQEQALKYCRMYRTYRHQSAPMKLLVFNAPVHMGGNTPVEFLLPHDMFDILTCYPSPGVPIEVPGHDIAFSAAPLDAADAHGFHRFIRDLTKGGPTVLNLPETLIKPERDTLFELFEHVPNLICPKTLRVARETLAGAVTSGDVKRVLEPFPFIVRPVGSHAGFGMAKIGNLDALSNYLQVRAEDEFYVTEFIDYASRSDRMFRKYRIVLIDGTPFPVHMAISDRWDVWYMNANMANSAAKRAEEAAFMDFFSSFEQRHSRAIRTLYQGLGLDYFGIDCAEDQAGNLVVFEADNALIVHDMDCRKTFPYKHRHMNHIFDAFKKMLFDKGERSSASQRASTVFSGQHSQLKRVESFANLAAP